MLQVNENQLLFGYDTTGEPEGYSPLTSVEGTVSPSAVSPGEFADQPEMDETDCERDEHVEICTISEDGTVSSRMLSTDGAYRDSSSPEPSDSEVFTPDSEPVGEQSVPTSERVAYSRA